MWCPSDHEIPITTPFPLAETDLGPDLSYPARRGAKMRSETVSDPDLGRPDELRDDYSDPVWFDVRTARKIPHTKEREKGLA